MLRTTLRTTAARLACAAQMALLSLALAPASGKAQSTDTWYVVHMGGATVGWMHEQRTPSDSGIAVDTRMRLVLSRLGRQVVMETRERSLERPTGALVRTTADMRLSEQSTTTTARVDGDSVRIVSAAGGRSFTRVLPTGGDLIGPDDAMRVTSRTLRAPGDSTTYRIFSSAAGVPVSTTRTFAGFDTLVIAGVPTPARRLVERSAASPVLVMLWIDAEGALLRSSFASPFGETVTERADSARASAADSGGELAEDQYTHTLVLTGLRLPQARRLSMLELELRADSTQPWPDLNGPGQRVVSETSGRLVLQITRQDPPSGTHAFPMAPTPVTTEYLAPNAYVQSDDSTLHALALRIVGSERDAWRATLKLERWVADSMHFDPGIAFAPSVEVVARRRGTCVAYATLLASLARTLGIPSRVAFGYGYVNGMLGGHAWTQVWIAGNWYAVDGALVPYGAADAARFAFAWGSLAGGAAELTSSPGARLYNGLKATVLAYRVDDGPVVRPAPGAAPWQIDGNTYRSASLALSFDKPSGFRWGGLDRTWPDMAIAEAVDDAGDTVRVIHEERKPWTRADDDARARVRDLMGDVAVTETTVAGARGVMGVGPRHAVIAIHRGAETLVVEAVGTGARELAARTARSMRFLDGGT